MLGLHRAVGAAGAGGHHTFGGSHFLSLPSELGPPTLGPGTANKILPSISSLKTISLLRMGFLKLSRRGFKPLFWRAINTTLLKAQGKPTQKS